jgi:H+-transporting ATPase
MTLAPFHTDTDPEDPVFHDQAECPYGNEIKRNGNAHPGSDNRRVVRGEQRTVDWMDQ